MKILIISRGYPSPAEPMTGLFEWDQARALRDAGHQVVLGVADLRSLRHRRPLGRERKILEGIPIEAVHIPAGRVPPVWLHALNVRAVQGLYRQVLRTHGVPDVIHSHFLRMGAAVVAALGKEPVPKVHTEHFSGLNTEHPGPGLVRMAQATYPGMDRVAAVSTALAERLATFFAGSATVIPNPVDMRLFYPGDEGQRRSGFHFVSTGQLLPNKRMDLLVDGFQRAFSQNGSVQLTIFGEGPEREKLQDRIRSGSAQGRIHLAGFRSREEIGDTLRQSHAFVLLSRRETFGVAYVEALASGLPILAAASGGPADFIRHSTGRMLEDDRPEGVARALQAMVREGDQYDGQAIARFARDTYSPAAVARTLTAWYEEAVEARKGGGA